MSNEEKSFPKVGINWVIRILEKTLSKTYKTRFCENKFLHIAHKINRI